LAVLVTGLGDFIFRRAPIGSREVAAQYHHTKAMGCSNSHGFLFSVLGQNNRKSWELVTHDFSALGGMAMVIIMQKGSKPEQVQAVIDEVEKSGYRTSPIVGEERTVIGVIGWKPSQNHLDHFRSLRGVEEVVTIMKRYKRTSRDWQPYETVVDVCGVPVGDPEFFTMMAGPCTVETRDQLLTTARAVKKTGSHILRGGAYKPSTSPYDFQGLGEEGLKLLAEARRETGLPVVTEVMSPDKVELVAAYADVLQIGTRNAQNYDLLKAVGQTSKPVLLKRGWASTIEEWLLAAEYIIDQGNPNVILCERGIRTYETATRNTLDLSAVAVVKRESHLPIVVDPSQGTGRWYLVMPMARAAVAAGADGLIIEVHPDPEKALKDGPQSLRIDKFERLMEELHPFVAAVGRKM
jgi:3-deoxy-7-phosphoheptulonate synthase